MIPELSLEKLPSSTQTLPNTPDPDQTREPLELNFSKKASDADSLMDIMQWFDEKGIKPGNPEDIQIRHSQQKRQEIYAMQSDKKENQSSLYKRRNGLKKGLNLELKCAPLIK